MADPEYGDMATLSPLVLHSESPVHKLAFASSNELISLTSKGVQSWNIGPGATGKREVKDVFAEAQRLPRYDEDLKKPPELDFDVRDLDMTRYEFLSRAEMEPS